MIEGRIETEELYALVKKRIIQLQYQPGEILNEADLADEFGLSRTPVRRVFQLLSADKLINVVPRYGAQVAPVDFRKMKAVFEVTRELDPFATRLAVERISKDKIDELQEIVDRINSYHIETDYQKAINDDERFHEIILESCGNEWLQDILTSLHYHTERLWHYCESYFSSIDLFSETLTSILEAIKSGDSEKAEMHSRDHIDQFVSKIKSEML